MRIKLYVKNLLVMFLFTAFLLGSQDLLADGPGMLGTKKGKKESGGGGIKPEIGISAGTLSFMGDVGYLKLQDPFLYKYAYALDVEFLYKYNIVFAGNFMMGSLFGNQKTVLRNVNFESQIFVPSVNVRYYLLKSDRSKRTLTPFISVGVEGIIFNTSNDSLDKDGKPYYYWKNGAIKDRSETDKDKAKAVLLHRDYTYESKASSGFALGFPLGLGIKLKLTDKLNVSLSATYHFTISDEIDNVKSVPLGVKESIGPDKFIYPAFSIHYDMGGQSTVKKSTSGNYKDIDFLAIEYVDTDGDGVTDFKDRCANTPKEAKVNDSGCPLDDDNDGIANYLDKEKATRSGALVDEFGVEINESYLIRKAKEDSIKFRGDTVYLRVTNERSVDTKPAIIAAPVVVPSAQEEPAPAEIKPAGEAIPVETKPATETPAETKPSTEVLPVDAPAVEVPKTPENPAPAEVKPEEKPEKKANEGLDINVSSKKPFILKGLNFKSQSFDLSNESKVYLDQVIAYIKANPSMKFEIGGHTDNTGGKGLNQRLSYDRAKSVYFYLISKGISKSRLSYEGYGSTFPIAPNTTAEGKAKNRRIELKLAK